ncbi:hypothetical protein OHD62_33275 [Mesorhizobium sp. YC-39]|uniref:hypothetical protein n=1 Tax=unclassified Mesorhizobium TaxID=325217 RepID=UPI0021E7A1CB|nr:MULTISPECIES: hypothetical protein [unclassified Mesorhizobium]MCV3211561.1 hypothetical protein [Mesorhizobium sp. YC-2]MCV3233241.1 hypothetical protein [Mesorhizobium sp. YC-39]
MTDDEPAPFRPLRMNTFDTSSLTRRQDTAAAIDFTVQTEDGKTEIDRFVSRTPAIFERKLTVETRLEMREAPRRHVRQ